MGAAVGILCLLGWLWYFQLHIFEYDAGMAFGSSAAISAVEGQRAPTLELWKVGTRRWIRFPVHTAFFPMFLAFPAMTLSTLAFGISANIYNVVGTILYDKRLERMGKPYTTYQTLTGNFLPRPGVLSGAADLDLPKRRHWREPAQYLAAFLIGLAGGVAYYFAMGVPGLEVSSVVLAAAMALVVAVCGGGLLSVVPRGRWHIAGAGLSWGNLLACLGTAMAIVSAVSLMAWFGLAFLATGGIPFLGLVLPMWIIVLWIGHVCLYFGGYRREWQPAGDPLPATGV
jgi:hypothetical protein